MKIKCNACEKELEVSKNTIEIKHKEITQLGIKCPHCLTFYHSFFLNKNLVALQKKLKKVSDKKFERLNAVYQKKFIAFQKYASRVIK